METLASQVRSSKNYLQYLQCQSHRHFAKLNLIQLCLGSIALFTCRFLNIKIMRNMVIVMLFYARATKGNILHTMAQFEIKINVTFSENDNNHRNFTLLRMNKTSHGILNGVLGLDRNALSCYLDITSKFKNSFSCATLRSYMKSLGIWFFWYNNPNNSADDVGIFI